MEKEKFLINNDEDNEVKVSHDDFDDEDSCSCKHDCKCKKCDCENCECEQCDCDNCCYCDYDESMIDECLAKDFESQVVERGKNYYLDGRVLEVYKSKNKYLAKVLGSREEPYNVEITINNEGALYECSCPYEFPCKHAYATLMAIANSEYKEVDLKPYKMEKNANLYDTINKIPAEELKEYMLSNEGMANVCIEMEHFNNYFRKYLPKQDYEFYYNRLYNEILLNDYYGDTVDEYLEKSRHYLQSDAFFECFEIIESIIEAFNDTKVLNSNDEVFEIINKIGMLLRIIYRKADDSIKKTILKWQQKLKENNYYNNYYLEDVMLTLV